MRFSCRDHSVAIICLDQLLKIRRPLGCPAAKGNCKTRDVEPASTRQRDSTNFSRDISKSATGLRPHEPGQLIAQSLRFVYSVFPMTRAWLARRRAAPHGRAGAALRAAFGGGQRFAPRSGSIYARLLQTRAATAMPQRQVLSCLV